LRCNSQAIKFFLPFPSFLPSFRSTGDWTWGLEQVSKCSTTWAMPLKLILLKYTSQCSSAYSTRLWDCHYYLIQEHFHCLPKKLHTHTQSLSIAPVSQALATTHLPSVLCICQFWAFHMHGIIWQTAFCVWL
jgi:hypothetical protein